MKTVESLVDAVFSQELVVGKGLESFSRSYTGSIFDLRDTCSGAVVSSYDGLGCNSLSLQGDTIPQDSGVRHRR